MLTLHPYQTDLITGARAALRRSGSVLIQAPTGSGKTVLSAFMAGRAARKGGRVWFVMHRRELIEQASETFARVGIEHGITAAGVPGRACAVQLCAVQSLRSRVGRMLPPSLVIWDECHHMAAGTWAKLRDALANAYHVGLSATPQRLDGAGLGAWFREIVVGPPVSDLIDAGFLSPYRVFAPSVPDVSGVGVRGGDYARDVLASIMDRPSVTGDAVSHYLRLARAKRAVVFCAGIEHSRRVVAQFTGAGVRALHVDGETPALERRAAMQRFRAGEIDVLSNVDLFGEGVDVPGIEAVILLRPTQSLGLYMQQVGRGLRPAEGKDCALILDHSGNVFRHGLPDDAREWSLDAPRRKPKAENLISVKLCPKCFRALRATVQVCPCGHEFLAQSREIAHVDGELDEVDITALRRSRAREQSQARTLEDLIKLGAARGYRNPAAWARHIIHARGGANHV